MNYRVFLSEEAWEFVDREKLDRQMLIRQLRQLPESGDFDEINPVDHRKLSITIVGDLAVTYFFDHPVSEIKILEIECADR